jgi:hypothetical protein
MYILKTVMYLFFDEILIVSTYYIKILHIVRLFNGLMQQPDLGT